MLQRVRGTLSKCILYASGASQLSMLGGDSIHGLESWYDLRSLVATFGSLRGYGLPRFSMFLYGFP